MSAIKLTDDQLIADIKAGLSGNAIARKHDLARSGVHRRIKGLSRKGYSPEHDWHHSVPDGYKAQGVSTYYDVDGQPRGQWVKASIDTERQREMLEAAKAAFCEDLPQLPKRKAIGNYLADLHVVYPLGDPHVGMAAWGEECGQSWDLAIAERVHCGAMDALVSGAPASETATIIDLGDMLHYDGMAAVRLAVATTWTPVDATPN